MRSRSRSKSAAPAILAATDSGDDVLYAGGSRQSHPEIEKFTDSNSNGVPGTTASPYDDVNKNGKFDGYRMVGFGTGPGLRCPRRRLAGAWVPAAEPDHRGPGRRRHPGPVRR